MPPLTHRYGDKWGLQDYEHMDNPAGSSLSKRKEEEKLFTPLNGGALALERYRDTRAPAITIHPSTIHKEIMGTYQTNVESEMSFLNRHRTPLKCERTMCNQYESSSILDDELLQKAVLLNLHSLLETSDSSVHLNSYSSMESDGTDDFRTAHFSTPKFPETFHFAAIRDQMLLDISKTMVSNVKSSGDLFASSSVSLNSFSFENEQNLSMKESYLTADLDVIDEEEMTPKSISEIGQFSVSTDKNESHDCEVEAKNTLLSSISTSKSPGRDYSNNENMLRGMKAAFISKLYTAFSKRNGSKDDDTSEFLHGYKMNTPKDDDDTLVTATTFSESYTGYSSSESASAPRARADTDISSVVEQVTQPDYEHKFQHASTSKDKSSTLVIPKYRFESLYGHGKLMIYRNRELDLHRRIAEKKKITVLEMQWRKKQALRRSSLKPISEEDVCKRLYTERSYIMNASGKKLRNAIARKSLIRNNERKMKTCL